MLGHSVIELCGGQSGHPPQPQTDITLLCSRDTHTTILIHHVLAAAFFKNKFRKALNLESIVS